MYHTMEKLRDQLKNIHAGYFIYMVFYVYTVMIHQSNMDKNKPQKYCILVRRTVHHRSLHSHGLVTV